MLPQKTLEVYCRNREIADRAVEKPGSLLQKQRNCRLCRRKARESTAETEKLQTVP